MGHLVLRLISGLLVFCLVLLLSIGLWLATAQFFPSFLVKLRNAATGARELLFEFAPALKTEATSEYLSDHLCAFGMFGLIIFVLISLIVVALALFAKLIKRAQPDATLPLSSAMYWERTFAMPLWERAFHYAAWFYPYRIPRLILDKWASPAKRSRLVDIWAFGNFLASITALSVIASATGLLWAIIVIWAALRIYESFIYQVNVFLFDEWRAHQANRPYVLRGYHRLVVLSIQNYFELIIWFSVLYVAFRQSFKFDQDPALLASSPALVALYSSFKVMTSFGFENIKPIDILGYTVIMSQALVGLVFTVVIITRFVSLLPSPKSMERYEQHESGGTAERERSTN